MDEVEFGRYRLISVIGRGGMGTVYQAHDTEIGRDVAIKVLPKDLANEPGYEARFRREAFTAARITEPHIIPIYDTGEIDGQLYLVMPIVKGTDVQELLTREGPLSPQRAVHIIEQLAAALDAAHAVGLVHRDIKPSNTLVAGRDFVYLIDFGIAHDSAATRLTSTGMMVGTLAYMAPERFTAGAADARSDVYALACVLHECLTGKQPYPGDSLEQQIVGHLSLDPPRPTAERPHLPVGLDEVIATGMAKDPDVRYQSAHDLATAARQALTTVPARDRPTTGPRLAATRPVPAPAPPQPAYRPSYQAPARPSPPPPPPANWPPPQPASQPARQPEPPQPASQPARRPEPQRRTGMIVGIAAAAVVVVAVIAMITVQVLRPRPPAAQTPTAQAATPSEPSAQPPQPSAPQPSASQPSVAPQTGSTPYVKLPGVAGCLVAANQVVCQSSLFVQGPEVPCPGCRQPMHMDQALVDVNGNLTWRDANLGSPNSPGGPGWYELGNEPYRILGWTVDADHTGHFTFTNDATRRGMKITWIVARDASHPEVSTF
jgi:serine/threonine protein kinase